MTPELQHTLVQFIKAYLAVELFIALIAFTVFGFIVRSFFKRVF